MKRFLCAVLIAVMLPALCAGPRAETGAQANAGHASVTPDGMIEYTNPENGYRIMHPASWNIADRETVDGLLNLVTGDGVPGVDGSVLRQSEGQIRNGNIVMFWTLDGGIHVIACEETPLRLMPSLAASLLCPQIIAQYRQMYAKVDVLQSGAVARYGDNEFVYLSMRVHVPGDTLVIDLFLYFGDKAMYTLAFDAADPVTGDMLASFATP